LWDSSDLWNHVEQDQFLLQPNNFVLAQTMEKICIPHDVVGLVEGRSSWARMGITIHVTAPKIDPGFEAQITLEMFNFGKLPINLRAGIDKPAQLMLVRVTTPLQEQDLYGKGKDDRFQGQTSPIPHHRKD
jgi:dCTP deaminase